MTDTATEWLPTRASLLSRLRDWDDQSSWKAFFDTYWRLIYSSARKSGLSDSEAQDVVQETIIAVAKQMPTFRYDRNKGTFKGWLLQTTRWRIQDRYRRIEREGRLHRALAEKAAALEEDAGRVLEWDRLWQENLLAVATERARARADPRQFEIYDLVVQRGMSAKETAELLEVSLAQVYYARHRVTALIRRAIGHLEREGV